MKRSEALKLIIERLEVQKLNGFSDKGTANAILGALEDAGMLPPELPDMHYKETSNQWGESISEFHIKL